MKCCFTGHRNVIITDELTKKLEKEIIRLIESGYTDFYTGGAIGWDMLCGKTVAKLRKKYLVQLNIILPCNEEFYTLKWNDIQKEELKKLLFQSDSIEYISFNFDSECIKKRNQQLVDNADICICYLNTDRIRCGTGQTVRMAKKKGIKIINLF